MLDWEKEGCKDILRHLSDEDIDSLIETSTQGKIKEHTRRDKINAIVAFTDSVDSLLRRRKITRELLLVYAYEKGLNVTNTSKKQELQDRIACYWFEKGHRKSEPTSSKHQRPAKQQPSSSNSQTVRPSPKPAPSKSQTAIPTQIRSPPKSQTVRPPPKPAPSKSQTAIPTQSRSPPNSQTVGPSSKSTPPKSQTEAPVQQYSPPNLQMPLPFIGASQPASHPSNISITVNYYSNVTPIPDPSATEDYKMASSFVKWFYKMLNSTCPTSGLPKEDFGPQHFWDNAELNVSMVSNGVEDVQRRAGSQQVVDHLISLARDQNLLFNPNVSKEGLLIRSDPHGLKLILACGSLHRARECIGIFQQSFGLVQDPMAINCWKIKVSFLRMKAQTLPELPNLETTGEINAIEGLTINALSVLK